METNWIKAILNFCYNAIEKHYYVYTLSGKGLGEESYRVFIVRLHWNDESEVRITLRKDSILLQTDSGELIIKDIKFSDRDELDFDTLSLNIKEYREKLAVDEFDTFLKEKEYTINNLYDE